MTIIELKKEIRILESTLLGLKNLDDDFLIIDRYDYHSTVAFHKERISELLVQLKMNLSKLEVTNE